MYEYLLLFASLQLLSQLRPRVVAEEMLITHLVGDAVCLERGHGLPGRTEQSYELVWHRWNG